MLSGEQWELRTLKQSLEILPIQCVDAKRINVSAAYFLSTEFQQTGYLVYRFYKAAYGKVPGAPVPLRLNEFLPDTGEIGQGVVVNQSGWEQLLESNKQAFSTEFVQRVLGWMIGDVCWPDEIFRETTCDGHAFEGESRP